MNTMGYLYDQSFLYGVDGKYCSATAHLHNFLHNFFERKLYFLLLPIVQRIQNEKSVKFITFRSIYMQRK